MKEKIEAIEKSGAEVHLIGTYSALDSMVASFITLSLCCFYPALSAEGHGRRV